MSNTIEKIESFISALKLTGSVANQLRLLAAENDKLRERLDEARKAVPHVRVTIPESAFEKGVVAVKVSKPANKGRPILRLVENKDAKPDIPREVR